MINMKKSYKNLLIFQSIIFFFLFINSFLFNFLSNYILIFFLLLSLSIFKFLFGFEKDNHRYTKDIIFDISIFLLIFFILYYLFGIFIGFSKMDNYYSFSGIFKFIIPISLFIIIKEYFRYNMLKKSEGNKLLIIVSFILFIFLDLTNILYYSDLSSAKELFLVVAVNFIPIVCNNILCNYLVYKVGYKPNILYLLVINLYLYLVPIVPACNQYLLSVINFLLPLGLLYRLKSSFSKVKDEVISRDYNKKGIIGIGISTIVIIILVYFTCGYFHYYAIAIGSNSMKNAISKGDVVVIEKLDKKYSLLKEGDILVYKYNGVVVVHRLDEIIKQDGEYYFYTKGDANSKRDNYVIYEKMVIGTVKLKIPFIGYPTVWFSEL